MDAFFFPTTDNLQLFGVTRGASNVVRVWLLCPPFAEEEKAARRLFTLFSQDLAAQGEAALAFSFRGTGDSEGDFEAATLSDWKLDMVAACAEAKSRFPSAEIALLGVRLGAALAWQEAQELGATCLILIEPLLSGRSFLMQQNAKKQLRAQLTDDLSSGVVSSEKTATKNTGAELTTEDLDGWALGKNLKTELHALDLRRDTPRFAGPTTFIQVGPKAEVAPPLQALSESSGARARAVVMPAFWNLIDAPNFSPLLQVLGSEVGAEREHHE